MPMLPITAACAAIAAVGALLPASATDEPTCSRTPLVPALGGPDGDGLGDEVSALQVAVGLVRSRDRSAAEASPDALAVLPSVDCVRVVTLNGSSNLALIKPELQRLGLWRRTTVQTVERDPEGGEAGCYRSHAQAWRESRGCSNLLVLEDDAFFDFSSVAQCTTHAEAFLQSGTPYDMLFLGYSSEFYQTNVSKSGSECAYRLHGWLSTHAYVISQQTMQEWADFEWDRRAIDRSLSNYHDRDRFFTVRPTCAFQRQHPSTITWDGTETLPETLQEPLQKFAEGLSSSPDFMHNAQERLYAAAGEAADAERCIGASPDSQGSDGASPAAGNARVAQLKAVVAKAHLPDAVPAAESDRMPSIDCVRVISMNSSDVLPLLEQDLRRLELWGRTTVQFEHRDPDGAEAGCYHAHERAWKAGIAAGCSNMLVLEEDAFFDTAVEGPCTTHAESFLQSGLPYDLLFLGYGNYFYDTTVDRIDGVQCVYGLHKWVTTHAYIASKQFMQDIALPTFHNRTIDVTLSWDFDRDLFRTVRPSCAFQRMRKTTIPWENAAMKEAGQMFMSRPATMLRAQDNLYAAAGEASTSEHCIGVAEAGTAASG